MNVQNVGGSPNDQRSRVRTVEIHEDIFQEIFTHGVIWECVEGLPRNTRIRGVYYDDHRRVMRVYFENLEWEPVVPGEETPHFKPSVKIYRGPELAVMRKLLDSIEKAQEPTV